MKARVDIGIACSGQQAPAWWTGVFSNLMTEMQNGIEIGKVHAISSALPDHNKNYMVGYTEEKRRASLTDANRADLTGAFLEGSSDWLFQIDDDTIPPKGVMRQLLSRRRDFIAGIYFLTRKPWNPIAYMRQDDGLYFPVYQYPEGAFLQVDSVGMGCTLIHRSVFEKILDHHVELVRPNGSIAVIEKSQIKGSTQCLGKQRTPFVKNGVLHLDVKTKDPDDNRPFPFFALEYGRTEDHHFCELAANVGVKPWLDTTITCAHIKLQETTVDHYRAFAELGGEA